MDASPLYDATRTAHGRKPACLLCNRDARPFDGYCGNDHASLGRFGDELTEIIRAAIGIGGASA